MTIPNMTIPNVKLGIEIRCIRGVFSEGTTFAPQYLCFTVAGCDQRTTFGVSTARLPAHLDILQGRAKFPTWLRP